MKNTATSILRLLLVVLTCTFMSPSFAWQMIDSHNETTIASFVASDDHHHHVNDLHHHHHHDDDGEGDDDTAHSQIGHLLSHLPVVMHEIVSLPVQITSSYAYITSSQAFVFSASDPPFKPPRTALFI